MPIAAQKLDMLDMALLLPPRNYSKHLNWLAVLTECVYNLEIQPVALYDNDNQKATTRQREACFGLNVHNKLELDCIEDSYTVEL